MALEVERVPCLADNYTWLLHDPSTGATGVVDTPEVGPIIAALEAKVRAAPRRDAPAISPSLTPARAAAWRQGLRHRGGGATLTPAPPPHPPAALPDARERRAGS